MGHEQLADVLALVALALAHGPARSRLELLVLGSFHVPVLHEHHALEVPAEVALAEHLGALLRPARVHAARAL